MVVISLSGKYASRDRTGNNTPDYLEMYSLDKNEVPGWSKVHGRPVNTPEATLNGLIQRAVGNLRPLSFSIMG